MFAPYLYSNYLTLSSNSTKSIDLFRNLLCQIENSSHFYLGIYANFIPIHGFKKSKSINLPWLSNYVRFDCNVNCCSC